MADLVFGATLGEEWRSYFLEQQGVAAPAFGATWGSCLQEELGVACSGDWSVSEENSLFVQEGSENELRRELPVYPTRTPLCLGCSNRACDTAGGSVLAMDGGVPLPWVLVATVTDSVVSLAAERLAEEERGGTEGCR